ncbi:MAG: 5-(carboxyamino)imidazole ribonucleotide synthase [Methylotenera sp.]|uniref:5-(carboxyamino)imidazole ribonucleotide synthase n=1 Tax=Methylotenera sp. TaxID=2051956 RepID=UPI002722360B|nr:5-(carboxyamino)imidazole ribonucleotide synthase [Methylotenera sp.]MDO9151427.1 5-(carboxyamino)imidazole ribonucleotide synthase [Methylotenera sp.]
MSQSTMILPPAMLGMLGGGQLGRFFVIAAHEMGYKVTVLDPDENSPAGQIADVHICAKYDDEAALAQMAETCQAITTEFENVPATTLSTLAKSVPVLPSAEAVAIAQHRVSEKNFIKNAGLPVAPYAVINAESDLPADDSEIYPAILKVARFGYDGKGQARVANLSEAKAAFSAFSQEECVLEKMLKLDYEVSVVLARDANGHVATFPTAENSHLNGILDISIVPARGSDAVNHQAQKLAISVAEKLQYTGVLGVEFFVCDGELLVNEIAPRPHNSGHYTLDACITNQFEQQVRVMTGLPLGSSRQHSPAVMVNLLGDIWPEDKVTGQAEPAWQAAFAMPTLKMHLYGKNEARAGRKMGHFTVLNTSRDDAIKLALQVRSELNIGN